MLRANALIVLFSHLTSKIAPFSQVALYLVLIRVEYSKRIIHLHPAQEGFAEGVSHEFLQPGRVLLDLFHVIGKVLIFLLPQITARGEGRVQQPFLVLRGVGGRAMVTARQHHESIARIKLGLDGHARVVRCGNIDVPQMAARYEASGPVLARALLASHKQSYAIVPAQSVECYTRISGVMDDVVAVKILSFCARFDAENAGIVELRVADAFVLFFGANLAQSSAA